MDSGIIISEKEIDNVEKSLICRDYNVALYTIDEKTYIVNSRGLIFFSKDVVKILILLCKLGYIQTKNYDFYSTIVPEYKVICDYFSHSLTFKFMEISTQKILVSSSNYNIFIKGIMPYCIRQNKPVNRMNDL